MPGDCVVAFSQRDLYQVRREIEKDSKHKCAIIYGGLPPGEETLVCINVCLKDPRHALRIIKFWPEFGHL